MIRRRWRLLLALTLLLLGGGLALVPGVRWPVVGWLRGEAFYQGMPASYWVNEVQAWADGTEELVRQASTGLTPGPGLLDQWLSWIGAARSQEGPTFDASEASLGVLGVLASHPEPAVRLQVMRHLAVIAQVMPAATVPYLRPALQDRDAPVRHQAAVTLYRYVPEQLTPAAVPILVDMLRSDAGVVRSLAVRFLADLGPAARPAVPALLAVWSNEADASEARQQCADALAKIDTEAATKAGVK